MPKKYQKVSCKKSVPPKTLIDFLIFSVSFEISGKCLTFIISKRQNPLKMQILKIIEKPLGHFCCNNHKFLQKLHAAKFSEFRIKCVGFKAADGPDSQPALSKYESHLGFIVADGPDLVYIVRRVKINYVSKWQFGQIIFCIV